MSAVVVRYRFRTGNLDSTGVLRQEALRQLAHALWTVPTGVVVVVDLGPCRQLQTQLIRDLALFRCAGMLRFEGSDWRAVAAHRDALAKSLAVMSE